MKKNFLFFCIYALLPFLSTAQDITGIWRGYFLSEGGDYYKLEFQVEQKGSTLVTGVSYSYLDVRFYGKATMTGSFTPSSKTFNIREIKTVEVKSSLGGATCIMNYNFTYSKSGKEEFMEGTYLGKYETKSLSPTPGKWGDCGGGKVFLRKVTTSDFYVEPFLRNRNTTTPVIENEAPRKRDSIISKPVVTNKPTVKKQPAKTVTTKPVVKPTVKPIAKNKPAVITKPVVKTDPGKKIPPAKIPVTKINTPPLKKPVTDSMATVKIPVITNTKPIVPIPTPSVLKTRSNELVKTLTVPDPEVKISIYDNGEIDDDTISVYLDKKLVLSSKRLTAAALVINLKMEKDDEEHELVMVAENLGRIPPNTSLMIVESGEQRFEVRITSTEQKNALVRFRYHKGGDGNVP
jgi:hypothetical protein